MENRAIPVKTIVLIAFAALAVRVGLLFAVGPQVELDTGSYLNVARVLYETGSFSEPDIITGQLTPYAYRMPFFHVLVVGLMKVFGADIAWPLAFVNVAFSVGGVLLSIPILYSVAGPSVAIAAGWLMAVNPNSVFNSVLLMTDSMSAFFSMIMLLAGIAALKRPSNLRFFLWGATIGLSTMIRPFLKFYWVVPVLLVLPALFKAGWKSKMRYALFSVIGVAVFLLPWAERNRQKLGFFGLELNQGVNTLVSTGHLVRPSTPEQLRGDPRLAAARDIVASHYNVLYAESDMRKRLGLSAVEASSVLMRLGVEVLLSDPGGAFVIWLRNAVNIMISPLAVMEVVRRLSGESVDYFPQISVAIKTLHWPTLIVNLGARLVLFLLFCICAPLGARLLWRNAPPVEKLSMLFLFSMIFYTLFLTAIVSGYDRYRLPLDPLLFGFSAAWLIHRFERAKREG
ncbi:MAG: hypothetical protein A2270_03820 [Elusimicrobia bacterium RIFOXYA12_FULL_51_18]|nr:MAG: hypothetical protein A2270_03820 [Elusimicrobia bacterium RIFOXYA12_FULL_51_18]OGS29879.1 MAG: hypothetical protein A2218_02520 [Elusimicrobia bacterium RIFOXYA2_FULL_53_38]